jgi:hypothetical protein
MSAVPGNDHSGANDHSGELASRAGGAVCTFVFVVGSICALALATGCSSAGSDSSRADATAVSFHAAVAGRNLAAACDLLAPRTREEVEQSARATCPQALADADLPGAQTVQTSDLYGSNARVVLAGDTVFLARFGAVWKVTAAGCRPRPDLPYDCDVKGS